MIKIFFLGCLNATLAGFLLFSQGSMAQDNTTTKSALAIFAGGCFWCMEAPFDKLPGVISTTSGYTGGHSENPDYKEVSSGKTGHFEAVQVNYDPTQVSFEKLLEVFWHNVDPYDDEGQFCDKGQQYKAVIFYQDKNEKAIAEASRTAVKQSLSGKNIATDIKPAGKFYPAEDYHQDYYLKNPTTYRFYRYTCGRDQRLNAVWKASKDEQKEGVNKLISSFFE